MRFQTVILALTALLWLHHSALSQVNTARISGVATDQSSGVLPGVNVTATDVNTGRQYSDVTDERGAYRLTSLPPGAYILQAALPGFATTKIEGIELLVGQNVTIPFTLSVAAVEETVTVTGESPLIEIRSSQVTGNVDRREMETLPLQGRNWMELASLVKGVTTNNITNSPSDLNDAFQLNLDGQEIKQNAISAGSGQPRFSREAIAEFQIVTNQFDITQGRSTGLQVHAISKSGTNTVSGVGYGFFRSDTFNAADPVAKTVLPYSNQQVGGVLGGPVVKDKIHYFFSYEYENEPSTVFTQPSFLGGPSYTADSGFKHHSYLARADWQLSPDNALTVRVSGFHSENPFQLSGDQYPSRAQIRKNYGTNLIGTWTQTLGHNRVGVLRLGYFRLNMSAYPQPEFEGVPDYVFPGASLGAPYNLIWDEGVRNSFQVRYDHTWNTEAHEFKFGGEFLYQTHEGLFELSRRGRMYFLSLPPPEEMAWRFPIDQWNNPSAWDLSGLDPITQRFDINFDPGSATIDPYRYYVPRPTVAFWLGDTWLVDDRLTIIYGVRWDDDWGAAAPPEITENSIPIDNGVESADFGYRADIRDHDNISPRVGVAYDAGGNGDLVIRGGTGLYYATPVTNVVYSHQMYNRFLAASFPNDGQPGFVEDPTRGVTIQDFLSGAVPVPAQTKRILSPTFEMPYTWQTSVGFQKQLGSVTAIEADLTHWKYYDDTRSRDPNLFFDPATGYNVDPKFGRPNPDYSLIQWLDTFGRRDYLALASGLTRRFKDDFQGGAAYTLMFYQNDDGTGWTYQPNNHFDYDAEWARSTAFQRHTLRLWGMYRLPLNLTVSGLYSFGSGKYFSSFVSGNPFGKGGNNRLNVRGPITIPEDMRDRFDGPSTIGTGEVAPRNALAGTALHKVDLRLMYELRVGGDARLELIAEVFNLLNHDNFGSFVTQVDNSSFGQPRQDLGNAYFPRSAQFGVRVVF